MLPASHGPAERDRGYPVVLAAANPAIASDDSPEGLRALASDYYRWRTENFPVETSDQGLHTRDALLTGYAEAAIAVRRGHIKDLLAKIRAMHSDAWSKDDRVDFLLFRAQLEGGEFFDRVLDFEHTNPQVYVDECSNAIFSLLKKDYDTPRNRALSATARLTLMPAMLEDGRRNLKAPVRLYAQLAIDSARSIDPLFTDSLMTLAGGLSAAERGALIKARDAALTAIHSYADWLEQGLPRMVEFRPMGEANYNYLLKHAYLLPIDADQVAMLGQAELARYRGLESLLPDPSLADPNPARAASVPADQQAFLAAYQSREAEMIRFLQERKLITLPPYLGPFLIRQLPEAFKPTSPGGFMNAPGVYDKDASGFYFIPTYDPASHNFYIRAAIEDPRPILGHEGIPGHFLQISIANHLTDEIRRHHDDGVFVEGWALYTEEMLMRTGLYPEGSAAQGQILRLSRYRAARIGVDVNLHTGRWTFEQAVKYFMEAGGLDRESAEGEAAGAASSPTQKITYMVGKWQIMGLLGRYRDRRGAAFRLGEFHDALIANGSLPLSVVTWLMLDDPGALDSALAQETRPIPSPAQATVTMPAAAPLSAQPGAVYGTSAPQNPPASPAVPAAAGRPKLEDVEERRGPFTLAGQTFTAVLHYKRLPGKTGPDSRALESLDILNPAGAVQHHETFSFSLEKGEFSEDCSVDILDLHGSNGEGLLLDTGCQPSAPMSGGPWQILGMSNGKLVRIGKPLLTEGKMGGFVPGQIKKLGTVTQILPDIINIRVWTGYFFAVTPVRINWLEGKLVLAQHCFYQTGHGFAEDGCEMPAEEIERRSTDQDMTFIRLFAESNERTSPPAHVVVKRDSNVEIIAGKALVTWQEENEVIQLGVRDDVWVKVRIDGKEGWIHTFEDLNAIGLYQSG